MMIIIPCWKVWKEYVK